MIAISMVENRMVPVAADSDQLGNSAFLPLDLMVYKWYEWEYHIGFRADMMESQ